MNPIDFDGANRVLKAPPGSEETVSDLPVFSNGQCCVSCWEPSDEELEEIVKSKKIFLSIWSGKTQPPVFLGDMSTVRSVVQDFGGAWKRSK